MNGVVNRINITAAGFGTRKVCGTGIKDFVIPDYRVSSAHIYPLNIKLSAGVHPADQEEMEAAAKPGT
jgi:hypothetical protein